MKDYIEVRTPNMKNLEGKLLTLLEATALNDRQLEASKSTARAILWDWHDAIFNSLVPDGEPKLDR